MPFIRYNSTTNLFESADNPTDPATLFTPIDLSGHTEIGGGSVNIKQTEVDFGSTPVYEKEFIVIDVDISPTKQIMATIAYEAPTGRELDEVEMEPFTINAGPGSGQLKLKIFALHGPVIGLYKVNYLIG